MPAEIGQTYKIAGGVYRGCEGMYLGMCRRNTRIKIKITKWRSSRELSGSYWQIPKQISPRFLDLPKTSRQCVDDALKIKFRLR